MNEKQRNLLAIASCAFLIISSLGGLFYIYLNKPFEKHRPVIRKMFGRPDTGRIAIIIDDWGYNKNCDFLKNIDIPIAISVLPNLPYSKLSAQCAHENNKEVMLHLPLEPHKFTEVYPPNYIITTNMDAKKIEQTIDDYLESVPYAEGINNHMGSKAVQDKAFMKIILRYLKNKKLFFVDSRVTSDSICKEAAAEVRIPFAQRDVFLDNLSNEEYIRNQIKKLANIAKKQGYAIGIAHNRPSTLKVIQEQSQKLKEQGFEFVTVKTLTGY
ncbi:MAG: divergent polysaccharide deacetylase family protein [Candidatus Omnitrophica bacterium]|nr:divergent polysaccharide deacetylase family protein [Candidatus Omnitrophota bacterium]